MIRKTFAKPQRLLQAVRRLCFSVFSGFLLLSGCSEPIDARIETSRVELDRNLYDRNATPAQSVVRKHVLEALKNTTNSSLQTPTLAGAILITREGKSVLRIWWVEDSPSIDGFEIRSKDDARKAHFALDKAVLDEMRNETTRYAIIFSYILELPSDMRDIDEAVNCCLTRAGNAVTPSMQIIRDDLTPATTSQAERSR